MLLLFAVPVVTAIVIVGTVTVSTTSAVAMSYCYAIVSVPLIWGSVWCDVCMCACMYVLCKDV